jgi:sugar porter (SP) family MFS transporter
MSAGNTLLRNAIVAALGGLLFGFDTAVISGTTDTLKAVYNLSSQSLGFTVAIALIGTIIGAAFVGKPADRFGRRAVLIGTAVFYFVSAVGCALAWDWYALLFFRLLGGLAVGGASVVSPMYIAEIAPAKIRGRLVALAQFNIVLGILLAFLSNYIIAMMHPGDTEWRWMFGIEAFPAAAFFFLLFANFDSPRWLIAKGRSDEAKTILARIGTDTGDVEREVKAIQESIHLERSLLNEPFCCAKYIKPISLAVLIAMFNQLSGINAILYYAPTVFKMAGAGTESAMFQSTLIGLTNLVFTMLALTVIDHLGRKKLMLVGSIGYIISLGATAAAFSYFGTDFTPLGGKIVLGAIVLFIASHAFGQGAVIWVFISEIFPNRVRARGQALGSFTHWIMAAAISWTFPFIAGGLGAGHVFAFYAVMMVIQLFWVLFFMPETKGVALEDIQKTMGIE